MGNLPTYLDCNATTPIYATARDAMLPWLSGELLGNAGSHTHAYGGAAQRAVNRARDQIATVVDVASTGVLFTSGATEANNLALQGLAQHGELEGLRHIVTTTIEHKAVLEPIRALAGRGFEVTLVPPDMMGRISAKDLLKAVRDDTLLISLMHVNNETGVIQPIAEVAEGLGDRPTLLHIDASQGFGKDLLSLRHGRIDLISISGHKCGGPTGIGALAMRKRRYRLPSLSPLTFGGGQERGLRPGTVPVMLAVGLGAAAAASSENDAKWRATCDTYRQQFLTNLAMLPVSFDLNMQLDQALPNCLNLSFRDNAHGWLDSESVLLALKDVLAASNGSACTSAGREPSHVLVAQRLPIARIKGAVRFSWCERTPQPDWSAATDAIRRLL